MTWQRSHPPAWGKFFWLQIYPFQVILSKLCFCGRKAPQPQDEGKFFDFGSIHFRWFWASLVFVAEKPPPMREKFWLWIYPFQVILSKFGFCGRKALAPPRMRKIFWLWIYPFQAILSKFGLCGRKAPPLFCLLVRYLAHVAAHDVTSQTDILCITEYHIGDELAEKPPPQDEQNFLTSDLSISGNFEQLWFCGRKGPPPPPPGWGKTFWHWIYLFQVILSKFGFCGRKARPPGWGKIFWLWIYPFQVILSNFGFCGRKAPPPPVREKFLTLDLSTSGNFEQVWFLWQKSPPPSFLPFGEILSSCCSTWHNFTDWYFMHHWISHWWWVGRKAPPAAEEGNFLTSDLSISGNFEQLWFLWQKSPPPRWGNIFWLWIYLFQAILSNFGFCGRKAPPQHEGNFFDFGSIHFRCFEQVWFLWQKSPPPPPGWGKIFWLWIYPFQAILSKFGLCGRKAPPPFFLPFGEILGSYCSTWHNFTDWYFMHHWMSHWWQVGRKAPPPRWGKFFWLQIYPFQAIFSKFGFCGRKAPPQAWGKIFWLWIYPFQAILSNFAFCGRKAPLQDEGKFFDFGSIHFRQFWATLVFVVEKPSPPPGWGKIFWLWIYPFQVILSKLCFCGRKAPHPQDEGKIFDFWSIHFRWFWATSLFVAEKPPPPGWGKIFWLWIYPFQVILSNFAFCGRKAPLQDEGKFFDFGSIHFRQFWATLVFVVEKPSPPPGWGKIFWLLIYPFQVILSKFGFCGRKASHQDEGKFFDFGSIHFRWFWASLAFVAEKPSPLRMRKIFWLWIYPFQAILRNFGFLWQKSPPPPGWGKKFWLWIYPFQAILSKFAFCDRKAPPPAWGKIFWLWIYPFQAILSNFGFCGRKAPSPRMREIFWLWIYPFQVIFEQLCFLWQKAPLQDEGKFFDFGSIHFRQFWASLVFVAEKPPPPQHEGKTFDFGSIHFRWFWASYVFVAEKAPTPTPRMRENFLTLDLSISGNFKQLWFLWQKITPPQDEGKFFDFGSIYFRWFWASLVFEARPPPQDEGKFFDFGSIHFRWFWGSLVFVTEKPAPPPTMREKFLTLDLSISGDFEQLWFLW